MSLAVDGQNESSATSCDVFLGSNRSIADNKYLDCSLYLECNKLRYNKRYVSNKYAEKCYRILRVIYL